MLDPVKLATLKAVVEHGSFSAAGAALTLTQPAVSRQVAALEARLGTPLLTRTRAGVRPTAAGRALLAHTDAVLARLRLAEREVRDIAGLRSGEVWLGSFFTALAYLSAAVAARLAAAHPGLRLRDRLVDRAAAFAELTSGEVDVALVFEHPLEPLAPPEEVELAHLFDDPVRVLLPAGHPLAGHAAVALADLAAEPWIRPHDGVTARLLDVVAQRAGAPASVLLAGRGDEPVEAQTLVAAGHGAMLAFALNVILDPPRVVARPLRDPLPARAVQAAVLRDHRPPATEALLAAVVEAGRAPR